MYGLYIDDVKGTCSPITDTMCIKCKKIYIYIFYCCFELEKAGLLQVTYCTNCFFFLKHLGFFLKVKCVNLAISTWLFFFLKTNN